MVDTKGYFDRFRDSVATSLRALSPEAGRINGLDGLRTFAVFAVLLCHTMTLPGGYIGVDVFFVLSGYLITSILLREYEMTGRIALGRFYLRRTLRLFPALLFLLAVWSVYVLLIQGHLAQNSSILSLPAVIFYVGNWVQVAAGPDALGLWGHTWSLAVEEQFYLIWPLLILSAMIFGRRSVVGIALLIVLLDPVLRAALIHRGASDVRMRGTDACADMLMMGCLLAALNAPAWIGAVARRTWPLAAVALMLIAAFPSQNALVRAAMPSATALASAILITQLSAAGDVGPGRFLGNSVLVGLGRISYGIYLWHVPITMALVGHISNRWILTFVVAGLTILCALISWVFVETPALRVKSLLEDARLRRLLSVNKRVRSSPG